MAAASDDILASKQLCFNFNLWARGEFETKDRREKYRNNRLRDGDDVDGGGAGYFRICRWGALAVH